MALNFEILRPDDLLTLEVETVNLKLDTSRPGHPRLVREKPGEDAYLAFHFPPQAIAEQAYFETAVVQEPSFNPPQSNPPLPAPPPLPTNPDSLPMPGGTPARMAGPSRLVFRLPPAVDAVDYDIASLLGWSQLEPVLPAAANVPPGAAAPGKPAPPIREPGPLETALELPYRLVVSPNVMHGGNLPAWTHASQPVVHAGRAELWHTRLGRLRRADGKITEASPAGPVPLRAVWSPDFIANGSLPGHDTDDVPFRAGMTARDRDQIVILSSGFEGYTVTGAGGAKSYVPAPADADSVFLSALGGWLTARGAWPYPVQYQDQPPLDLIEWDHVATQGRDHYVRIVYEGFLYPFGHQATLVKVTERKVLAAGGQAGNPPVAYLRQRMYIVVRELEKSYTDAPYAHHGKEMPLASLVRINTRVTPEIDPPTWIGDSSFWVQVGGQPFQFHLMADDLAGEHVNFLAPLIFVSLSETQLGTVASQYVADNSRRRCAARGQNVTYADPSAGDTALKTNALYFTSEFPQPPPPAPTVPFIPSVDLAEVTIPALSELIGQQVAVVIELYPPYLQTALDPNAGVFAQVVGTPPGVAFSADQAGGFARPNISLTAVSARKGIVSGDPTDAAEGTIQPSAYFGDIDARLFGTIDLGQLIPIDKITQRANAAQNAPEIRTQAIPNRRHPTQFVTVIDWRPQLQDFDEPPISIAFNDGEASELHLHVQIERQLDGSPPLSMATGRLSNFKLKLVQIIELKIAAINFSSQNGAKSTVVLDLAPGSPIAFDGPLQFVQALASLLPPGLFGGMGPSIQATSTAVRVTYTLSLPPVTCGVFSLEHIAIMAGVDLPYLDGKPAVEFAFASRNRPFLLTVEIFGGGGFVHVILDADGVQMVEGALEFGGNYALDVGVASGAVHAMAGIYFQLKGSYSDLTGFVDIGGEVSVLGIISVSIDLNLSLSWQQSPAGNVIEGRATLTVSVHVLFFSASVQLSVERSFSAGRGDPKVDQLMTERDWRDYALAFAQAGG